MSYPRPGRYSSHAMDVLPMIRALKEFMSEKIKEPMTVRRRTDRGVPDVGLIFPDKPAEVIKVNVWELPMTPEQFAAQPRETYKTPGDLLRDGWTQD